MENLNNEKLEEKVDKRALELKAILEIAKESIRRFYERWEQNSHKVEYT